MTTFNPAPKPQRRRTTPEPLPPLPATPEPAHQVVDSEPIIIEETVIVDVVQEVVPEKKNTLRDVMPSSVSHQDWLSLTPQDAAPLNEWETPQQATPPPAQPAVGRETLAGRTRKRVILISGVYVVVGLLAINAVINVVNRPPSSEQVASEVSSLVASDGALSSIIGTGEHFLNAYFTVTPGSEQNRDVLLNSLSGGNASGWVGAGRDARPQEVFLGPTLAYPPTPSSTYPGAFTLAYSVWVTTENSKPEQHLVSITVEPTENGRAVVVAPPALLPLPAVETPQSVDIETDANISQAATANLEQFLKAWAQASPDTQGEISTQLQAFMSPEASSNTRSGLGGVVSFESLSNVRLAPTDDTGTQATGTVQVRWKTPAGVQMVQSYSVDMVNIAGKWLVSRIGAL